MLSSDVRKYFNITRDFENAGTFDTAANTRLIKELKVAIPEGRLIVISGIIGCGKTSLLLRLKNTLEKEKKIIVSRSLAVEKNKVNMLALMTALFQDLATERDFKPPTQTEIRERKLVELFEKAQKPVVLFVDDAHALHHLTLTSLKRLIELIRDNGNSLSVVLAGHPKLGNDLRRAALEEIGGRASVFPMQGIKGEQQKYIKWMFSHCTPKGTDISEIIQKEALDIFANRLATPLQIHHYMGFVLTEAYGVGQKPITPEIVEDALARDFDDIEPKLIRQGYDVKVLATLLNIRPAQIRSFLNGQLDANRTEEMRNNMQKAGIPLFS